MGLQLVIVKVRLIASVGEPTTAIVSDESGRITHWVEATRPLVARMKGRVVAYFEATQDGPRAIDLMDLAPDQAW